MECWQCVRGGGDSPGRGSIHVYSCLHNLVRLYSSLIMGLQPVNSWAFCSPRPAYGAECSTAENQLSAVLFISLCTVEDVQRERGRLWSKSSDCQYNFETGSKPGAQHFSSIAYLWALRIPLPLSSSTTVTCELSTRPLEVICSLGCPQVCYIAGRLEQLTL